MTTLKAAIAATRFGLGARPGEMAAINNLPKEWLLSQIRGKPSLDPALRNLPGTLEIAREVASLHGGGRKNRKKQLSLEKQQEIQKKVRGLYEREVNARLQAAVETSAPFRERLVHFWANHFTVSASKPILSGLVGAFEREAIRPHVTGRFENMLMAAASHPAMISYLDNNVSVGPNSTAGRHRHRGLNENLAREILELHTLGVDGGYSQKDVTNFAKILTGWTFAWADTPFGGAPGTFQFVAAMHEPGSHKVMGKTYRAKGVAQPQELLKDLARHPATASHIATKLAQYFIADEPPAGVVARLRTAFLESDGDLGKVTEALVASEQAWTPQQQKFKRPFEYVVSTLRAVPSAKMEQKHLLGVLSLMGQRPFAAPSPAGWPDQAAFWASPDGVLRRIEWSNALSHTSARSVTYEDVIENSLGPLATENLEKAASRAENRQQALVLVLASPEFMRR